MKTNKVSKGFLTSAGGPISRKVGGLVEHITFWDVSNAPTTNKRILKLGAADSSHGAAIFFHSPKEHISFVADGIHNSTRIISRRKLEPDNWVLRLHDEKGRGQDSVWATRNIVEHENKAQTRKHRSTMWIDQCDSQDWAFSSDALWLRRLGAENDDEELRFNGAGFLNFGSLITTDGKRPTQTQGKKSQRGVLAFNVSKRGGYITDGPDIAQLWHLLGMMAVPFARPTPPPDKGGTRAAERTTDLFGKPLKKGTQAEEKQTGDGKECKAPTRMMAALRGDVNFDMEGNAVHLAVGGAYETHGPLYSGKHWIHGPSPKLPGRQPALDPNSNQPELPRGLDKGLWCYVAVTSCDQPMEQQLAPGHGPSGPGAAGFAAGSYPSVSGGVADAGDWNKPLPIFDNQQVNFVFPPAYITNLIHSIPLPEWGSDMKLRMKFPYTLPTNLAEGETMEFRLFYKKYVTADELMPTTWEELTAEITYDDNPSGPTQVKFLTFEIPRMDLINGRGSGKIAVWFMRRSDDGVAKNFHLMQPSYTYIPWQANCPTLAGEIVTVAS